MEMLIGFVSQWNNFIEKLFQISISNNLGLVLSENLYSALKSVENVSDGINLLPFPAILLDKNKVPILFNDHFSKVNEKIKYLEPLPNIIGSLIDSKGSIKQEAYIHTLESEFIEGMYCYKIKSIFYPLLLNGDEVVVAVFLIDNNQIENIKYILKKFEDLKIILNDIPYIIYIKDSFDRIIWVNTKFEKKFNIAKRNIEGEFSENVFAEEVFLECIKKENEIIISGKPLIGQEERFATKTELEVWALVDRIPILNTFGKVVGIFVLMFDLTKNKQKELELRRWKERFDIITTATGQAVFERDWESGEVVWTENIQQILGYSAKELTTREKWLEKIYSADLDLYLRKFNIHCGSLTPYTLTYRVVSSSGKIRFVKEIGFFLTDNSKIISVIGIISDITDQKDLEQKISDYNMFLHVLLDTIPMPIFYENIEGKIIGCNKVFQEQILTLPKKEFLGKTVDSFKQIFNESFIENHKKTNREIIEKNFVETYDVMLNLPHGSSKYFAVYKSGYKDFDGNLAGIINILIDITDRKKAEEALRNINLELEKKIEERTKDLQLAIEEYRFEVEEHRRVQEILEQANFELKILNDTLAEESQKLLVLNEKLANSERDLREANSAKDKFFTIIAHDLKNPLQSILTESEILERFFDSFEKDKIREYVHHIFKTSNLLKNLLENLLTWAKTQTGRISFRPEWVNIDLVLSDVVRQLEPNSQNKEIVIIYEPRVDIMSYIDRNLVTIVVRNLLNNAIKFSRRASKVYLSAEEIIERNIPSIKISVRDEGVGIAKEKLDKLFKIEYSSSTPGTEKEQGTGLGLVICKELIELHKGRIWVESEVGLGSTFSFVIPINFD
ncbi:MAG: PAS domain-containing sensor histidine kinase [Candidatus Kapaibacteriales bacterium]